MSVTNFQQKYCSIEKWVCHSKIFQSVGFNSYCVYHKHNTPTQPQIYIYIYIYIHYTYISIYMYIYIYIYYIYIYTLYICKYILTYLSRSIIYFIYIYIYIIIIIIYISKGSRCLECHWVIKKTIKYLDSDCHFPHIFIENFVLSCLYPTKNGNKNCFE